MSVLKNRYGEFRSGWSVTIVLILIIVAQMIGRGLVPEDADETSISVKIITTLVYSLIAIGGGILLFKLLYRREPQQMGLYPAKLFSELLHGFVIGAVSMILLFAALLACGQAEIISVDISRLFSIALIVELISVSLFAFSEELLARGFIMTALKTTRNKWVIILVPAVIFSLVHLLNDGITAWSLINTFLAGLLFTYMFIKTGKLWLSSGFHIAWNFFQGDILGMITSGSEATGVLTTELGTNELLAGGSYGPEGSLLVTGVLVLAFLYVHYVVKKPEHPAWTVDSDLPFTRGNISVN